MADQAKEQAPPPKDNKKLFIIIGAAVAVVAIIGVAAMLFLGGGSKGKKGGEHEEAKVEKKSEEGGHGEGGKGEGKTGNSSIYPLEPFIVNIYDGQEIRYLKLKVEFELASPDVKNDLDAKVAPLRDAILVLLTTKTMQEIQDLQGKNQLRDQILSAVNKIIPMGKISKVYFTDFVVQ